MISTETIIQFLETACPPTLAEDWDNVGFLIGDRNREMARVMTCLTVTPESVAEGVEKRADLIVSHHPFPFRSERRWTNETTNGRILLDLIRNDIAVFSPHTAHDSAFWGINRQLAAGLELTDVRPLLPGTLGADDAMLTGLTGADRDSLAGEMGGVLGTGRIGRLPMPTTLADFIERVGRLLKIDAMTWVGDSRRRVETVAIGCGAADDFISTAAGLSADVLLLGEARFHGALEARARGLSLVLPGHYATERFAMETLGERMARVFPDLTVWASERESDPIQFYGKSA